MEKYGEPSWQSLREAVRSPAGGDSPVIADNIILCNPADEHSYNHSVY